MIINHNFVFILLLIIKLFSKYKYNCLSQSKRTDDTQDRPASSFPVKYAKNATLDRLSFSFSVKYAKSATLDCLSSSFSVKYARNATLDCLSSSFSVKYTKSATLDRLSSSFSVKYAKNGTQDVYRSIFNKGSAPPATIFSLYSSSRGSQTLMLQTFYSVFSLINSNTSSAELIANISSLYEAKSFFDSPLI